ncbi:MAG TPA: hypothetical protein VK206_06740 [Anaerolineales bacterium]|nr:hypothetical protein [Anaerolineales bacterium]
MSALRRKSYLLIFLVLLLSSCTKAGSQGTSGVMRDLRKTNLDSNRFPWIAGLANGRTKRWDIEQDGLIPVKLNGSTLGNDAIKEIEAVLHMSVFDTATIANLPDDQITRGIIVSEETALSPSGFITKSTCGHVSALPTTTNYPKDFYDANGKINTRLYVNLSSKKCTASLEIAVHEFGHALGLGSHFSGFGSGDAISPSFWQVLYTLYHNEIGTSGEDLQIQLLDK